MADDQERLVVLFEARLTDFERRMRDSVRTTQRTRTQIEREADRLAKNIDSKMAKAGGGFGGAMGLARNALGIAGVGLGAKSIIDLTSAWTDLNARVVNAVGSMSQGSDVMARLSDMARRTYSGLTQTAEAWLQNSTALTELGYSTSQQLDLTEALNNALVISSARGDVARSVMEAWSKAMALGELRGQNLNTVIQSGGRLAKALADSMGVSTTELRRLGTEGKITTAEMYNVTSQLETLRAEADAMPATLADSFVLFGDAIFKLVGQADQATGATAKFADEIIRLSDAIDKYAGPAIDILGAMGDAYERLSDSPAGLALGTGSVTGPGYILDIIGAFENLGDVSAENLDILTDRVGEARLAIADMASEIGMLENVRMFAPELPGEIQAVIDKLLLGETTADEAKAALLALGQANLDFSSLIGQLAGLVTHLNAVTTAAGEMSSALNAPQGPTSRSAGANRAAIRERAGIGSNYVAEQEEILSLSRQELQVRQAIQKIMADVAERGGTIEADEAERLAKLQVAARELSRSAGGGRTPVDRFEDSMESMRQRTNPMQEETALLEMIRVTA